MSSSTSSRTSARGELIPAGSLVASVAADIGLRAVQAFEQRRQPNAERLGDPGRTDHRHVLQSALDLAVVRPVLSAVRANPSCEAPLAMRRLLILAPRALRTSSAIVPS